MINAEDLRIGNILEVKYTDQNGEERCWCPIEIESIDGRKNTITIAPGEEIELHPDYVRGLKLNSSLMQALGFRKVSAYSFAYNDSEGWNLDSRGIYRPFSEFSIQKEFVHQLQNFVYELNGEMLQFKKVA